MQSALPITSNSNSKLIKDHLVLVAANPCILSKLSTTRNCTDQGKKVHFVQVKKQTPTALVRLY